MPSRASMAVQPARPAIAARTCRTLTESSTIITRSSAPRIGLSGRGGSAGTPSGIASSRLAASRMRTTRPSPRTVAPDRPGTPESPRPRIRTTTSRVSSSSSTRRATRRPPLSRSAPAWAGSSAGAWPPTAWARDTAVRRSPSVPVRSESASWPSSRSSGVTRTTCSTAVTGTAKVSPAERTMTTRARARVSGRRIEKVVPLPGSERASIDPLSSRTMARTTSRPTPRPEISLTCARVLKPASKIRASSCSRLAVVAFARVIRPVRIAAARIASRSRPAPSSMTSTTTSTPS